MRLIDELIGAEYAISSSVLFKAAVICLMQDELVTRDIVDMAEVAREAIQEELTWTATNTT